VRVMPHWGGWSGTQLDARGRQRTGTSMGTRRCTRPPAPRAVASRRSRSALRRTHVRRSPCSGAGSGSRFCRRSLPERRSRPVSGGSWLSSGVDGLCGSAMTSLSSCTRASHGGGGPPKTHTPPQTICMAIGGVEGLVNLLNQDHPSVLVDDCWSYKNKGRTMPPIRERLQKGQPRATLPQRMRRRMAGLPSASRGGNARQERYACPVCLSRGRRCSDWWRGVMGFRKDGRGAQPGERWRSVQGE
jgi:hypothetical protein